MKRTKEIVKFRVHVEMPNGAKHYADYDATSPDEARTMEGRRMVGLGYDKFAITKVKIVKG